MDPWYSNMVGYAFNTSLHLEVWPMGERLGFSEAERFEHEIKTGMIPFLERNEFFIHLPEDKRNIQTYYHLVAALLSPAADDVKHSLRSVAEKATPIVFSHAQKCCETCRSSLPLGIKAFFDISDMLLAPLNIPPGSLYPVYHVLPPDPDFRMAVLQRLKHT